MEYRNTKQRTKILELLQATKSHPTANWLYDKMRVEYPSISLGTIYRNLGVLEKMGMLQKITNGATFDRYDANIAPHIHYYCENCNNLYDLDDSIVEEKLTDVIDSINYNVDSYSLICYGECEKCSKTLSSTKQ